MTSEVHAAYGPHFAAQAFADSDAARAEIKNKAHETLARHYGNLEEALKENGGEWYLDRRSFADVYLYVLTRWIEQTPMAIDDYPAVKAHLDRMQKDEGVIKALGRQDMEAV